MSGSNLNLRARAQERPAVGNLGRRVARLHTAQTTGLAVELSKLMWGADPEGRTTFVSQELLETAGYERDELTGHPLSCLLALEDDEAADNVVGRFVGGQQRMPMTLRARDGSTYRVAWEPVPRRDRSGRLIEVIGVAREILPTPEPTRGDEQQLELLEAARACVIGMEPDGTIFFFNREAEATFGYERDEVEGRNYFELFVPRDDGGASWHEIKEHVAACLAAHDYESTVLAKDGRPLTVRWASAPMRPDPARRSEQEPGRLFIFGVDVTEARERERQDRVLAEVAALSDGPLAFDNYLNALQHHLVQLVAFDAAALVRYDAATDTVVPVLVSGSIGAPGDQPVPASRTATGPALATRRPYVCGRSGAGEFASAAAPASGPASYAAIPLFANGAPLGAFVVAAAPVGAFGERDITFLQRVAPHVASAFEAYVLSTTLDEVRARHQVLFDGGRDGALRLDAEMRCIEANAAACEHLGAAAADLVGRTCAEILSPTQPNIVRDKLAELPERDACPLGGFVLPRAQGAPLEIEAVAARLDGGGALVWIGDVTERNRFHRDHDELARQARWLTGHAWDAIALVRRGRLEQVNAGLVEMFGCKAADELRGRPVEVLYAPDECDRVRGDDGCVPARHEFVGRKRSGATFPVEARTATFSFSGERLTLLVLRDLSERAQLKRTLDETRRISGIAELARGVADDFNNLLVTMLGSTTLARSLAPGDTRHDALLERIRDAASRAAELTSQLLAYSHGGRTVRQPVSLNQVASDTLALIKGCIPKSIRVITELVPDLPTAQGDPHQLMQATLQVLLNAVEAMPGGGDLVVATDIFTARDETDPDRPEVRPGHYVRLIVLDAGGGMDEATLRHVCEPFFSTRSVGRGLGMAATRGVITHHNGFLTLSSSPGEGTEVEVLLPTAELSLQREEGT